LFVAYTPTIAIGGARGVWGMYPPGDVSPNKINDNNILYFTYTFTIFSPINKTKKIFK
jgi:hypothetical protein